MAEFENTAVLGAGVIGASWTALFLASGRSVAVYDVAADTEQTVRDALLLGLLKATRFKAT